MRDGPTLNEMAGLPNPPGCECGWVVDPSRANVPLPPEAPPGAKWQRYVVCDVCVAIARKREADELAARKS